jgi:hypothetical protein
MVEFCVKINLKKNIIIVFEDRYFKLNAVYLSYWSLDNGLLNKRGFSILY